MSIFYMKKSHIAGMYMKRLNIILSIIAAAAIIQLPSVSGASSSAKDRPRKGDIYSFSVYLKMEKLKFYVSEEVMLHIVIKNITDEPATFYVFDLPDNTDYYKDDLFGKTRGDQADFNTFRPVVYDMNGRNAELIVPYNISGSELKKSLSWMVRRAVTLGPGESFTHTQNLSKIYKLQPDTDYRMKLHFFPFLNDQDEDKLLLSSNEIKFTIARDREYQPYKTVDAGGVRLVPSEVIILLLNAEKDGYWDRAVKYIDVEKFIHSYPDFSRKYDLADDSDKKIIEKDFIRYFISKRSDYLVDFRIVNEEIEPSGLVATVSVVVSRKSLIRPERYRYVYTLQKNSMDDYIWMVSGIEATIIRNVKR